MIPFGSKICGNRKLLQSPFELLLRYLHEKPIKIVGWKKPEIGWTKLNFDGSCKCDTGKSSIGGVFRNHNAEFLMGFSEPIGKSHSTNAEFLALRRGLELTLESGWNNIWVEGDCLSLFDVIEHKRQVRCSQMQMHLEHINMMLHELNTRKLTHIYREGNRVADKFAKMGHDLKGLQVWHETPPEEVLRIVQEDAQKKTFMRTK